jgi:hypothetical protein
VPAATDLAADRASPEQVPAIAEPGHGYGSVFEADFIDRNSPAESRSIEIVLFADDSGHLSYVEIDFCGNGLPVPGHLHLGPSPYRVFESDRLLRN